MRRFENIADILSGKIPLRKVPATPYFRKNLVPSCFNCPVCNWTDIIKEHRGIWMCGGCKRYFRIVDPEE